ncbi:MAG TPA: squalene/phytoene synthase family protein [Candidatus Aquabacterium excrementipullorum]|nr:squalene/phytoene synthase family protein [Candidatus Aquabacterium excrementipullorum]
MSAEVNVPRPGSSLHLALLSAGPARPKLQAWTRWWHEVSRIPYEVSDPSVADRKLAWWAQAVNDAFRQPPQHPLLRDLLMPNGQHDTSGVPPLDLWLQQIEGLQVLTQQTRWMDETTLVRHMKATTGSACEGAVLLGGSTQLTTQALARRAGVALRRVHILARLGQDARQGWLHIPIDVLQRHGVRAHELLNPVQAAPDDLIRALLDAWAKQAREDIQAIRQEARDLPPAERRAWRPLAVLLRLSLLLLEDLAQAGYPVLRERLVIGAWRKLWAAQRERWKA